MALLEGLIARLEAVPDLAGRVGSAADLAEMMRANRLPQVTPAAFVVPAGMTGGAEIAETGPYRQDVTRIYSVVLVLRAHDATGTRALAALEPLLLAVIEVVAGWQPLEHAAPFVLRHCRTTRFEAGTLVQEFQFTLTDQLRFAP